MRRCASLRRRDGLRFGLPWGFAEEETGVPARELQDSGAEGSDGA